MEQKPRCPICNGTGLIIEIGEGGEVARPCECSVRKYQENKLQQLYDNAHLPKGKIREATFEDYLKLPFPPSVIQENSSSISTYKKYHDDISLLFQGPHIIWIYGSEPNACHTTLAVILGKTALQKNYKVFFLSMQDLINIFFNFESLYSRVEKILQNDLIIVDDAFDLSRCSINQKTSKFILSHIFSFFNELISNDKRIICTSNVPIHTIDSIFDEVKILLLRSSLQIELKGSISTYLQRMQTYA